MGYGRDTERDATDDGLFVLRVGDARKGKEKPWLLIKSTAGSSSRGPRSRVARQGVARPLPRRPLSRELPNERKRRGGGLPRGLCRRPRGEGSLSVHFL